jgi:hypothetical protein
VTYKKYKISFDFLTYDDGLKNMEGIIRLLESFGIIGTTQEIGAIGDNDYPTYIFDGDGTDFIKNIKIKEDLTYDPYEKRKRL